jgi:hypothetical protein
MTGHVWVIQTSLTAPLFIFKCQNHPRIERVSIYPLVSLTILEHLSSPPVFCEVRFTRSLVLCALFVYICPFVLFHCVVCSSSIYGFWLPLWYLQALITYYSMTVRTVWYILFVILWQFELCGIFCFSLYDSSNGVVYYSLNFLTVRTCCIFWFPFYDSSNSVVYFIFHLMTVRTEWSILFFIFMTVRTVWNIFLFIWWQFERCGIFFFSFYDSSNGVVYFVFELIEVIYICSFI